MKTKSNITVKDKKKKIKNKKFDIYLGTVNFQLDNKIFNLTFMFAQKVDTWNTEKIEKYFISKNNLIPKDKWAFVSLCKIVSNIDIKKITNKSIII